jgi:hypothetical protein
MQAALPLESAFRRRLHALVLSTGDRGTVAHKQAFYQELSRALHQAAPWFEYGVWDYWDDNDRAHREFADWAAGLQGKEARSTPGPAAAPGEKRYMLVTLALLLRSGSNSDHTAASCCNALKEIEYWRRDTFARLSTCVGWLNFASVESDVLYLVPGDDSYALTTEDLLSQNYHYLRSLE